MNGGLDTISRGVSSAIGALGEQAFFGTACLALALVFVFSAVPKLRKPELAALAIVDFGVTQRAHPLAGFSLGAGELALACCLALAAAVTPVAARATPPALAAVALWIFVALIARALRTPERFECFCFGEGEQISIRTLLRTSLLGVLASVLTVAAFQVPSGSPSATSLAFNLVIAGAALGTLALLSRIPTVLEVTS